MNNYTEGNYFTEERCEKLGRELLGFIGACKRGEGWTVSEEELVALQKAADVLLDCKKLNTLRAKM